MENAKNVGEGDVLPFSQSQKDKEVDLSKKVAELKRVTGHIRRDYRREIMSGYADDNDEEKKTSEISLNKEKIAEYIKNETGQTISDDDPTWAMIAFADYALRLKLQEMEKKEGDFLRENIKGICNEGVRDLRMNISGIFDRQTGMFEEVVEKWVELIRVGAIEQVVEISNDNLSRSTKMLDEKSANLEKSTTTLLHNLKTIQGDLKSQQFWTNFNVFATWVALLVVLYLIFFR